MAFFEDEILMMFLSSEYVRTLKLSKPLNDFNLQLAMIVDIDKKKFMSNIEELTLPSFEKIERSPDVWLINALTDKMESEALIDKMTKEATKNSNNLIDLKVESNQILTILTMANKFKDGERQNSIKDVVKYCLRGTLKLWMLTDFNKLSEIEKFRFLNNEEAKNDLVQSIYNNIKENEDFDLWFHYISLIEALTPYLDLVIKIRENKGVKPVTFKSKTDGKHTTKSLYKRVKRVVFVSDNGDLSICDGVGKKIPFRNIKTIAIGNEVVYKKQTSEKEKING